MKTSLIAILAVVIIGTCSSGAALAADTGFPGSAAVLLGNEAVRRDLSLSRSQCAALDTIRANYKTDVRQVTAHYPQNTVEKKAANATIKSLNEQYNAKALAVLNPGQLQRLDQIGHQTLGGWMLLLPRIQDSLHLAESQKKLIAEIHAGGEGIVESVNRDFEEGKISLQERLDKLRSWRLKESKKLLRVLTAEQRRALQALQGPAFQST